MISERDAALFSYLAYAPPPGNVVTVPVGWERVEGFNNHDDPDGSGFGARVFRNAGTGDYVVAFRGSDVEWNDWTGANRALAWGDRAEQLEQALQLIADMQKDGISLADVTFTGHSLGGGLATLVAVFFNRPAITLAVAPFEYSARDDVNTPGVPWNVSDYFEGYAQYLSSIGGPSPDNNFGLYRDAWRYGFESGDYQQGLAMLAVREAATRDWYATLDPVYLLSAIYPEIAASRTELTIGNQSVIAPTSRHDIRLITLLSNSVGLRQAFQSHEILLETLSDQDLYAAAKEDTQATSFYVHLLRSLYSADLAERDLVDHFATDLNRVRTGLTVTPAMERALIATAIEYYNYADPATAGNFFTPNGGQLRFDLRQLPTWDPYGPQGPTAVDERAGRGTDSLFAALPIPTDAQGYVDVLARAREASVWTVKSGTGGLTTAGLEDSEVQVGAATSPNSLLGAGGDDVLYGGLSGDLIDGGVGDDILIGDGGHDFQAISGAADTLRGGDGRDYLLGGGGLDTLEGGDDADVLIGGRGSDRLLGGAGDDTYVYNTGDGADRIVGGDADGVIIYDGVALNVIGAILVEDKPSTWFAVVGGQPFYFNLARNGELRVSTTSSGAMSTLDHLRFTIENFHNGDLGITLPAFIEGGESIAEGRARAFTLSVPSISASGQLIRIAVGAGWHQFFKVVTGAQTLDFKPDGTVDIPVEADQSTFRYSLISVGDVDQDDQISLSATLLNEQRQPIAGSSASLAINFDATDEQVFAAPTSFSSTHSNISDPVTQWFVDTSEGGSIRVLDNDADTTIYAHPHTAANSADLVVEGAGGADWIEASAGRVWAHGGSGNDAVWSYGVANTLTGDTGSDLVGAGAEAGQAPGVGHRLFGGSEVSLEQAIASGDTDLSDAALGDMIFGAAEVSDDLLVGGSARDVLAGGGGSDILVSGAGNDLIFGDHWITFFAPGDARWPTFQWDWTLQVSTDPNGLTVYGYQFTNSIQLGTGATFVNLLSVGVAAVGAADSIYAGVGDDLVYSGAGDDLVDAGSGNDVVFGNADADTLLGGVGDDVLVGDGIADSGADFLDGGEGNDRVDGMAGADVLYGGAGNDTINGDLVEQGAGEDYANGEDGDDRIWGGASSDIVIGGAGDDQLYGDSINTTNANAGDDFIDGGDGDDLLFGNGGEDTLIGGTGADELNGHGSGGVDDDGSADYLDGGAGNDLLFGGGGGDQLLGGEGDDQLIGDESTLAAALHGDDEMDGGAGADVLFGLGGNDTLLGGADNDALYGGAGDDILIGGTGLDYMRGEAGDDQYVLEAADMAVVDNVADGIEDSQGLNRVIFNSGLTSQDAILVLGASGDSINIRSSDGTLGVIINNT